jgi:hypothetical protein
LLVDPLLCACSGGEHRDHGADTDNYAEHGQRGAEQVGLYRLQRYAKDLKERQAVNPEWPDWLLN